MASNVSVAEFGGVNEDLTGQTTRNMSVRLREALQLSDLQKEHGTIIEIDPDSVDPGDPEDEEAQNYVVPDAAMLRETTGDTGSDSDSSTGELYEMAFDKLRRRFQDITEDKDGGVMKRQITAGAGPVVAEGAKCTFHMTGYLEYADEPYDSTYCRSQPYIKSLDEVIPGLDIALRSMKVGERSHFLISHEYGYGKMGAPPRIPQNAEILLDVSLISWVPYDGVDEFERLPYSERKRAPFEEVLKAASTRKKEGADFFKMKQFKKAEIKFQKAKRMLEDCTLANEEDEEQWKKILLRVYLNLAVIYICHMDKPKRAIHYCNEALGHDRNNAKALYLKGKSLHRLDDLDKAYEVLLKAKQQRPTDKDINEELQNLGRSMRMHQNFERNMYGRMFSWKAPKRNDLPEPKNVEEKDPEKFCSPEFQQMVNDQLRELKEDESIQEMPINAGGLTEAQAAYYSKAAESLGFRIKVRGKDTDLVMKVVKPQ